MQNIYVEYCLKAGRSSFNLPYKEEVIIFSALLLLLRRKRTGLKHDLVTWLTDENKVLESFEQEDAKEIYSVCITPSPRVQVRPFL